MSFRPCALLLVSVLLSLAGCVEYDETLTLNGDGSGVIRVEEAIDLSFVDEIRKIRGDVPEEDGIHVPTKEEIEKGLKVEGIKIRSCEVESKGKRSTIKVEVDFASLAALRSLRGFAGRRIDVEEAEGHKATVRYVISGKRLMGDVALDGSKDPEPTDEQGKKIAAILKDARERSRLRVALKLPGGVAVEVKADGKPESKPCLARSEDVELETTVARAAVEKLLAAEKARKAASRPAKD